MRRRERWPTREERHRMREAVAEAGGVSAWIRAGRPSAELERTRKARMNALAVKCGMARPYPEIDEHACSEGKP
ncbi:MAG TPA: hypothetical protein DHW63_07045 [Hyphomonadaceae bacterium]|nr:hypothetical protein [Hyphomonadaceae bacterium]